MFAVFLFAAVQTTAATAKVQTGVVVRVVDGDTLWLKASAGQQLLKVRLQGIDAPEICQQGGLQASRVLQRRVLGKLVTLLPKAHDDYGRIVGIVRIKDQDLGRWLVAQGHAWVYSFRQKKAPYADEFRLARLARRGLFSAAVAEEPRLFRKRHGSCYARL